MSRVMSGQSRFSLSSVLGLSLLAGCGGGVGKLPIGANPTGFAILSSNYKVTSVALYNPDTGILTDDCVHSGEAQLPQNLSGDATLPSAQQENGELIVIDSGNSTLTFVDPATCIPRTQQSVGTAFDANPHDVVMISAHKAYVTRYNTNANPTADPADFDEGDDLLVIDPSVTDPSRSPVLNRIDLASYASSVPGATLRADPDRAVLAAGKVYVTLNSISADYSVTGPGRVVVVDPATDSVTSVIDLPDQRDCSGIQYLPVQKRLYVSCGGTFADPNQVAQSALVEIDISGAAPVLGRVVSASSLPANQALNFFYSAVLGDTAFIGTLGTFADATTGTAATPDGFYAVPLGGGAPVMLGTGGPSKLGIGAVDPVTKKIFLPDADDLMPRVHVYEADGTTSVAASDFQANPAGGLPPRAVAPY